jgi:hypothetical protein
VESLVIRGGQHSWLYEFPEYRRTVARFLATALGGPLDPEAAGEIAAEVPAVRIPEGETPFAAVAAEPGGLRTLAGVVLPDRRRREAQAGASEETDEPASANRDGTAAIAGAS